MLQICRNILHDRGNHLVRESFLALALPKRWEGCGRRIQLAFFFFNRAPITSDDHVLKETLWLRIIAWVFCLLIDIFFIF